MDGTLWFFVAAVVLVVVAAVVVVLLLRRQWRQSDDSAIRAATAVRLDAEASAAQLRADAERFLAEANRQAEQIRQQAEGARLDAMERLDKERSLLGRERESLLRRESGLGAREAQLLADQSAVDTRATELSALSADLERRGTDIAARADEQVRALEAVAHMSREEAVRELINTAEHDAKLRAAVIARDIETGAREDAERRARAIIVESIQRLASDQTAETVVTTVDLPSDELKGRIIGREGRNIRVFEQVTGVNVLIDDTPGTVLLSCFDPVRREVARMALADLVADGRIHPQRIEDAYERARAMIDERMLRAADDALAEVGITDIDPGLRPVIGALRYRTSYGQNVLKHVIECAHLAALMAAELGLDVAVCSRAAFLHDLGKAVSHEHEGSHAAVGADLARRHGEHPDIVHAIEAHHNEVEPRTVEAVLTQAADAISGSRPGARRESLEAYVKRLERLEQIASAHEGVERVFAMQAGREVRVMVSPREVDDLTAATMARDIARQIEEELTYSGQIRVTVVRESRAIGIAH